jgi:hypothetical protein
VLLGENRHGSKLVCVAIDGRPIGFSDTRPAPGVH